MAFLKPPGNLCRLPKELYKSHLQLLCLKVLEQLSVASMRLWNSNTIFSIKKSVAILNQFAGSNLNITHLILTLSLNGLVLLDLTYFCTFMPKKKVFLPTCLKNHCYLHVTVQKHFFAAFYKLLNYIQKKVQKDLCHNLSAHVSNSKT